MPGVSVRLMGISNKAIATYLVTLYFSVVALVPDALGILENVDIFLHTATVIMEIIASLDMVKFGIVVLIKKFIN